MTDRHEVLTCADPAATHLLLVASQRPTTSPTAKTINSRVPRWKRNRLMASPRNKVTDFVLPIMFQEIDSVFSEGASQA